MSACFNKGVAVGVVLREKSHSDAAANENLAAGNGLGFLQALQDAFAQFHRLLRAARTFNDDREFVAAQPRDGESPVVGAAPGRRTDLSALLQRLGRSAQNFIAHLVAEAVVNVFEVVQIDKQQGHGPAHALRAAHRLLEPVQKQRPVGQSR